MRKERNRGFLAPVSDYTPFENSEEAWLWYCLCESLGGVRGSGTGARVLRPCESSDILLSVKKLMQKGKLNESHMKVLEKYGFQQMPPHENAGNPVRECSLWREGLRLLEGLLKLKGIVVS